uniref:Uncharacterized protein n=1 Tax=Neobodo designis TaxID=312471 RepID=A0A7S1MSL3_NEODS|mmetsp:Transcript_46181/g.142392  ORF Transcript_46181/g.142392 Transcript_46181/m.142392 type:complete len:332 (+) Transcript_46181:81-1076(+)
MVGEDDDDGMSVITAWTSLVVGSVSFLSCVGTIVIARLCARRHGYHGWVVEDTPNLFLYLALLASDATWGFKYSVDALLRITEAFGGADFVPCQIFGFVDVTLTMLRATIGTVYWLHVGAVVWGILRYGAFRRDREWRAVRVVSFSCLLLSIGVAFLCLGMGWIHRKAPGAWCWFDDDSFWQVLAFGYAWDGLQLILSLAGLAVPTCTFPEARKNNVWGRQVKVAFRVRAAAALVAPALAVVHGIVRDSTRAAANHADVMLAVSAVLIPLEGFIEAVVFVASEPQVLRAMLCDHADDEPHTLQRTGFTTALEAVFDRPAPTEAAPIASYGF